VQRIVARVELTEPEMSAATPESILDAQRQIGTAFFLIHSTPASKLSLDNTEF